MAHWAANYFLMKKQLVTQLQINGKTLRRTKKTENLSIFRILIDTVHGAKKTKQKKNSIHKNVLKFLDLLPIVKHVFGAQLRFTYALFSKNIISSMRSYIFNGIYRKGMAFARNLCVCSCL